MKRLILYLIIVGITFLTGCNPVYESQPEELITPSQNNPTTPNQGTTLSIKKTLVPTNILPTVTPKSSMTVPEIKDYLIEMLQTNGNCLLPCIWGIQPDKDMNQKPTEFFDELYEANIDGDIDIVPYISQGEKAFILNLWEGDIRTYVHLSVFREEGQPNLTILHGQIIRETGTGIELQSGPAYGEFSRNPFLQLYWLPNILEKYGKPSDVLMNTTMEDEMDRVNEPMGLLLIYADQGFLVGYTLPRRASGTQFVSCPSDAAYYNIISWDPSLDLDLQQMLSKSNGIIVNAVFADGYKSIPEVSQFTVDEFYRVFQQA